MLFFESLHLQLVAQFLQSQPRPGMDRTNWFTRGRGNFLAGHPAKVSHLNYITLFFGQGFDCCPHLFMFGPRPYRFRNTWRWVGSLLDQLLGLICRLALGALPSQHVNRQISGDAKEPAGESAALVLKQICFAPDAPECLLHHFFCQGLVTGYFQCKPHACRRISVIKHFIRGCIAACHLRDQLFVAPLLDNHSRLNKNLHS